MPNYEQKERKKFFKLKENYEREIKKSYPLRDDLIVDDLRDKLRISIESLVKKI